VTDDVERLDLALEGGPEMVPPEVRALVETAAEIMRSMAAWALSPARRELLYQRALAEVERRESRLVWRRWRLDARSTAAVGGAVVAAAAAAAIAVAITRGRRHHVDQPATVAA
jgi:hypothetical protein